MTAHAVQLEIWHLVLLLLAFFGAVGAFGQALVSQFEKRLDERFANQETLRAESDRRTTDKLTTIETDTKRLERELLELQVELPKQYVQREDWLRFSAIIDAKQDGLAAKIDLLGEKINARG